MIRKSWLSSIVVLTLLAFTPSFALEMKQGPVSVSPGSSERLTAVGTSCPTFSWTLSQKAESYELLVYRVTEEESEADRGPVLRQSLPQGASSWTPSGAECLVPGERYFWVVRAAIEKKSTAWSEVRTFRVASAPSAEQVRQALLVLDRVRQDDDPESIQATREGPAASQATSEARFAPPEGVSLAGTAAIRGTQSDASGDTLGVIGTVDSPEGAGVAAANTAGGVDLLLDGSSDAETDTLVTQASIDRSSVDPETFAIENSGGGGMTVLIDGVPAVTTATDSDTLAGLSCANNQIAQWNGTTWVCATNQGGDTLASLNCTDGQVVHWNGAAWVCGQPDLQFQTCGPAGSCSMSCPAGTIVWVGGCEVTSASPSSISKSFPTSGGAGQPPTGWQCAGVNPIGGVSVTGYLYCVGQ